jgi:hypothetical protein
MIVKMSSAYDQIQEIIEKAKVLIAYVSEKGHLFLDKLQYTLEFAGCDNTQFQGDGIGKIGVAGFLLGIACGIHISLTFTCLILKLWIPVSVILSPLLIWSVYASFLTLFHFLEFLMTALHQPSNLCYNSFIISHSKSYTLAACKFYSFSFSFLDSIYISI